MSGLSNEDREALAAAIEDDLAWLDDHTPNGHWLGWYLTTSRRQEQLAPAVEQIVARHVAAALTAAASAIDTRRHTYVQSGGLAELIPSNHADAERLGHLDGLAAAAEIVRALAAPQTPDARR